VLNNDSAVLLLIPIVVPLVRRLFPGQPELLVPFALVVFMAAGVAPLIVSNPMNMIVAEYAGVSFNAYAARMAPICLAGWLVAFVVLRRLFARHLALAEPGQLDGVPPRAWEANERHGLVLLLGVLGAYPLVSYLGGPVFAVAGGGAVGALLLCARHQKGSPADVVRTGVSWEILLFLAGVSTAALGLRHTEAIGDLAGWYRDSGLVGIGASSALGSAILNNHPMSLINMLAIDAGPGRHLPHILAALVGGDLGPRLLPTGSLAGLLWFASLQRVGVRVRVATFCWVGALVTIPALVVSLAVLAVVT
jgi:arsenical pump membrane protein